MIGVYQVLNKADNKRYIGSSSDISTRLAQHKNRLKSGKHENSYIQRAYDKHGVDNFDIKQILECSLDDLEFYEQLLIDGYKSNQKEFGYNLRKVSSSNRGMTTSKYSHKSGDVYNRLTLKEPATRKHNQLHWICECTCGNTIEINPNQARQGHTKSCGCLNKERLKERIVQWNKEHPEPWNKKKLLGV